MRIHNTHLDPRRSGSLTTHQGTGRKPNGLWWSDGSWRELLESGRGRGRRVGALDYEVVLPDGFRLLEIGTVAAATDFTVRYGAPMPHSRDGFYWQTGDRFRYDPAQDPRMPGSCRVQMIRWDEVKRDHDGIDVTLVPGDESRTRLDWYDLDWDVASGCAWRVDGIRLIRVPPSEPEPTDEGPGGP